MFVCILPDPGHYVFELMLAFEVTFFVQATGGGLTAMDDPEKRDMGKKVSAIWQAFQFFAVINRLPLKAFRWRSDRPVDIVFALHHHICTLCESHPDPNEDRVEQPSPRSHEALARFGDIHGN